MTKSNVIDLAGREEDKDPLTALLRTGARTLIHNAVEAELKEVLESHRDRRLEDGRAGVVRNGYQPERQLQTGIGPVTVRIPKVRAKTGEPVTFRSALVPPYVRKTKSLEAALPWLYLKGISTGEMSEALEVLVGPQARGLSAATVARLKKTWGQEYSTWRDSPLDRDKWAYIWADGVYSGLRSQEDKLCALVIIGVNEHGQKRLLAVEDGVRESTQSWREVLLKLKGRGMNVPKLAIGDGAMGFWAALEEVYGKTRQQRCWMHKTMNILNCLPKSSQPKAKGMLHEIWQAETRAAAEKAFTLFVHTYEAKYPKATRKLQTDHDELLAFYDFPAMHWQSLRTTNPIESTFGTIRHRTKRSKGCLSRDGMLHMMFKLGQCAEQKWRRLRGYQSLGQVIANVKFKDGIEESESDQKVA
ncbi:Transposase (or an inactivated derivative) [Marinobacter sp. LV10R510-11A]|uniref:IS256 family transposase n=1 Tax=Marinobacter sp. LV10R510-11A TaxID=1415568 RepID=UPI000BB72139|nr:IS256 family transposase [Marinobacter sp. LV10R510-11A]SOB77197.1 Transposase (or an inactivated derivative) [Marinobacter sp. LV10R510-11A]SOB77384.1 Transposase (or an inactivated derivative) [Marinobacter sp. LV10R510-11A]